MFALIRVAALTAVKPIGHLVQRPGAKFIVRFLTAANVLRNIESRRLKAVFQRCDAHDEQSSELWLPLADAIACFEVSLPGRAELEQHAIGKRAYPIEVSVDRIPNFVAILYCFPKVF